MSIRAFLSSSWLSSVVLLGTPPICAAQDHDAVPVDFVRRQILAYGWR